MDDPPLISTNPTLLREAMARRLYRRSVVTGQITLPAVPGMIDEYVTMCDKIFAAVGRRFTAEQLASTKTALEGQLAEAYTASQRSKIVISFNAPVGTVLNYHVKPEWVTIEATYDNWAATREPPLFGTEPDARVLALANEAADPTTHRVLDIGAGTGRNALALARRGHPVDVVEVTAKFGEMIRSDAERESLDVRVIQRDVFETMADLRRDYQLIVVSEVVPDFRTTQQLRGVFELAAHCLAPDGRLVLNTFLARHGYTPDDAARELGQQVYSCMFTRDELSTAAAELPLELLSDDSAPDYEKAHLPDGAWPPKGWYAAWASGLDVFDVERENSPIELRWLVYRKTVEAAMTEVTARPAICLNMIVRNEAHIVHEVLDAVAPYITSWVIVDTGSDDGTPDVIRSHMASLGIPGELHERPWRNFGHNRSEALALAQGHGDYIWVIDADDMVVGTPDFGRLSADVYSLRLRQGTGITYWRRQLFRDGLRWRYEGVVHEYAACDDPFIEERVEGEYYIDSRRLGGRNVDPEKYERDRDLLLAEVERNPDDRRSVFYLAQSYRDMGDFANARKWYARRVEMGGGWDEELYCAMFQVAETMSRLGEPWPDVQDAYLRAWEFRPTRAEALHAIAYRFRTEQRYRLGHFFAKHAAEIPFPAEDILFVGADVYAWRALDEQSVCASWIGKHLEAFTLCRRLVAGRDVPDDDRKRIAANRDISAPAMIDAASPYPDALAQGLVAGPRDSEVTVSLFAGPDRTGTEQTLNSFLHSCEDVSRVGRFLVLNAGLSAEDGATLLERYRFLEFIHSTPEDGTGARLAQVRGEIEGRFWLHLGEGWRFFAPERFISRLTAVLEAEPEVFQVAINFEDAAKLTGATAAENAVHRTTDAGRYVLADVVASGPAMFETARLDRAGGVDGTDRDPLAELGRRAAAAGLRTASLDEVLCIAGV